MNPPTPDEIRTIIIRLDTAARALASAQQPSLFYSEAPALEFVRETLRGASHQLEMLTERLKKEKAEPRGEATTAQPGFGDTNSIQPNTKEQQRCQENGTTSASPKARGKTSEQKPSAPARSRTRSTSKSKAPRTPSGSHLPSTSLFQP